MQGDFFQLLKEQGYQFGNLWRVRRGWTFPMPRRSWPLSIGMACWSQVIAEPRRVIWLCTIEPIRCWRSIGIVSMAIAGVPATAYEMVRVLEHSFKYYRRTQLQELSFEGKLRAISKLLKENVPAALAGTGAVVPVFAGYDHEQGAEKLLYDIFGAQSEAWSMPYPAPAHRRFEAFSTM